MANGKLLRISEERSIFIIENEDGDYLTPDNKIRYRNIGEAFETKFVQESYVSVDEKGMIDVLDEAGKSKFHFPSVWLETLTMKIIELQELGILRTSKE